MCIPGKSSELEGFTVHERGITPPDGTFLPGRAERARLQRTIVGRYLAKTGYEVNGERPLYRRGKIGGYAYELKTLGAHAQTNG